MTGAAETLEEAVASLQAKGFEVFLGRHGRSSAPLAGLQLRRGLMSLNQAAYRALGEPSAIVLAYNDQDQQIAIRPAQGESYALAVRRQARAQSYLVSIRSFLDHVGLQGDGVLKAPLYPRGDWLIANLKNAARIPKRRRRPSGIVGQDQAAAD